MHALRGLRGPRISFRPVSVRSEGMHRLYGVGGDSLGPDAPGAGPGPIGNRILSVASPGHPGSATGSIEAGPPVGAPDESALLVRLRAGDGDAYEQVIREFGGRLLATAQHLLPNEDDAREAVQDAFLSAFRAIGRFDGKSRVSTWLHRIVVNAALMKLRTKRRRPERSLDEAAVNLDGEGHFEHPALAVHETAGSSLDAETMRSRVQEEIERLPEEYRTVLVLRDVEELDTAETAEVLGLSTSAVKTRLHRARLALRERLLPYLGENGGEGQD